MAVCDTCGNHVAEPLSVTQGDRSGTFDSIECLAHALAPTCARCGCRILGHPVHDGPITYCCQHCADVVARNIGRWKDDGGAVM